MPTQAELDEYWGRFKRDPETLPSYDPEDLSSSNDDDLVANMRYMERLSNKQANSPAGFKREELWGGRLMPLLKRFRDEYHRRGLDRRHGPVGGADTSPSTDTSPDFATPTHAPSRGGYAPRGSGPAMIGQHVDAPTPAPFRVGAMGPSMRSLPTKMLAQLLQFKMAQQGQQRQMAAKAALMAQQQNQQNQIIASLSPQEQVEARQFGLKYVADRRKAAEASGAADRRAGMRIGAKTAADEEKHRLATSVLGETLEPILARGRAADANGAAAAADTQMSQNASGSLDAPQAAMGAMPGGDMVAQMLKMQQDALKQRQQGVQAQSADYQKQARIITPAEWRVIQEAQRKAGVAIAPPKGFQLQEDVDHQAKIAARQKKDADKLALAEEAKQAARDFVADGANEEEVKTAVALMPVYGAKGAVTFVVSQRNQKRKDEAAKAKAEESSKKAKEKADAAQAETDAKRAHQLRLKLAAEKDVKTKEGREKQADGSWKTVPAKTESKPKMSAGERAEAEAELKRIENRGKGASSPKGKQRSAEDFGWRTYKNDDRAPSDPSRIKDFEDANRAMNERARELDKKRDAGTITPDEQEELDAIDNHLFGSTQANLPKGGLEEHDGSQSVLT